MRVRVRDTRKTKIPKKMVHKRLKILKLKRIIAGLTLYSIIVSAICLYNLTT